MKTSTTLMTMTSLVMVVMMFLVCCFNAVDAVPAGKCGLHPYARQQRGDDSTTERCCVAKYRACWDSNGIPRCYYRKPNPECVNVMPPERVSCGGQWNAYNPPTRKQCLKNDDCCFDDSTKDATKMCYHKAGCNPGRRLPCGVSFIPRKYCLSRGCCYDEHSEPHCFLMGPE